MASGESHFWQMTVGCLAIKCGLYGNSLLRLGKRNEEMHGWSWTKALLSPRIHQKKTMYKWNLCILTTYQEIKGAANISPYKAMLHSMPASPPSTGQRGDNVWDDPHATRTAALSSEGV
ncbi:hypothetical protein NDU88_000986 [Pleurodeles waltl]|uniref:Uncharacterized protein n=1 Tax=Pleurodeles waltl TaxID=8319 RepID=A0AAV7KQB2_PLEWA|nr:hypothetical protein NDU88_000986 [Pleurodeles waltl]